MNTYHLFTDGACQGNPGPGGWGALIRDHTGERMLCGGESPTTNNRMEMMGAAAGLEAIPAGSEVVLTTDSQYVKQGIELWVQKWRANGWRTAAGKPVKNQDLWLRLAAAVEQRKVRWEWVRGHNGHPENERVDEAARVAAQRAAAEMGSAAIANTASAPAVALLTGVLCDGTKATGNADGNVDVESNTDVDSKADIKDAATFSWVRRGGYEVSSKGDTRFSAFRARLPDGRTIEEHYQCDVKGYDPGGTNWRAGKGKPPLRQVDLWEAYLGLWRTWGVNHGSALDALAVAASGRAGVLSDCFASTPVNQAHALSVLLNERAAALAYKTYGGQGEAAEVRHFPRLCVSAP